GLNINVNTVCPGWIDTKMAVDFHSKWSKQHKLDYKQFWKESMAGTNMLKTMGTVEDIAEFAVYLASPKGRFIHAQAINICGGLCYW
ncbi:MAG TPA: SDR family oxidoreductase, partial [Alphaproteobacteria bacterium]|nr:SDR family oxidoreductase [Alphaproteobacteria bacterium]